MKKIGVMCAVAFALVQCTESTQVETETQIIPKPNSAEKASKGFDLSEFTQASSGTGLAYRQLVAGNGAEVSKGHIARANYAVYYANSGELVQSNKTFGDGGPIDLPVGDQKLVPGLEEGMLMMREGDRFQFYVPPQIGYTPGIRNDIDITQPLIFDVEVFRTKQGAKPYRVDGLSKRESSTGLVYYIVEHSQGEKVKPGQQVTVHYSGYMPNGQKFDSSVDRGQPFTFVQGAGQVIRGWEEAVLHLRVGEKARFFIPYEAAYGEQGFQNIPPKTDLTFDIEVIAAQ